MLFFATFAFSSAFMRHPMVKKMGICLLLLFITSMAVYVVNTLSSFTDSRIWLHHAASPLKARLYRPFCQGMEVDVRYDEKYDCISVDRKNGRVSRYSLAEWCSEVPASADMGLWLDFKNLLPENADKAVACLCHLREQMQWKGPVYVESASYELYRFAEAGFQVSLYLPADNGKGYDSRQDSVWKRYADIGTREYNLPCLSGPVSLYPWMQKNFPKQEKLLWTGGRGSRYRQGMALLHKDPKVHILLID